MEEKNPPEVILLIDDDGSLCELVAQYLSSRGYSVETRGDGESGLQRVITGGVALVVLDVMLPGMDGFEVLRRLRGQEKFVPVVMLTAHGDEIDRIIGLEMGADDYLSKPFNPRELLARVRAVLRRGPLPPTDQPTAAPSISAPAPPPQRLVNGAVSVDIGARSVWVDGTKIELTATEFDLLVVLLQAEGQVVTRDALARKALGRRLLPFDRSLDLHMSKLRRKLGNEFGAGEGIKTVRGVGFLLAVSEARNAP